MINSSFVFGMDEDDGSVFDRTVEWAVGQGIETVTFHRLTPIRGRHSITGCSNRGVCFQHWDLYDTRHVIYQPARLSVAGIRDRV